ncbi:MAG: tetratricopeptide repeat protein, partial [Oscillospiraceae bacterium]|nr:tetratricopeptide repeat protein [Oscillospiraceae bacterium]
MDKNSAFIKGTVGFAAVLTALLIVLGCRFWTSLPDIYEERISALAAAGKPEAAIEKYDKLKVIVAERLEDDTKDSCEYAIAQGWLLAGDYEQAQFMFAALGDFRDSAQMVKECIYLPAQELFDEGKYDEAAAIFRSLGIYSDSANRYKDCRMAVAELHYAAGEYSEAINVFREVGDYNGAMDRIYAIAMELTGDEEFAQDMVSGKLSEADQEILLAREYARQKLKTESIAAGKNHTVAILSDGSVAAIGDNSFGQCDVSGWTDVVAVYAGANFTVGLCSDGSVLATGDNTHGQCDVSGWSNVKKLAVNDHDTLAVTEEGKLLFTGYHDYSDTLAAENIKDVFAG